MRSPGVSRRCIRRRGAGVRPGDACAIRDEIDSPARACGLRNRAIGNRSCRARSEAREPGEKDNGPRSLGWRGTLHRRAIRKGRANIAWVLIRGGARPTSAWTGPAFQDSVRRRRASKCASARRAHVERSPLGTKRGRRHETAPSLASRFAEIRASGRRRGPFRPIDPRFPLAHLLQKRRLATTRPIGVDPIFTERASSHESQHRPFILLLECRAKEGVRHVGYAVAGFTSPPCGVLWPERQGDERRRAVGQGDDYPAAEAARDVRASTRWKVGFLD